MVNDKETLFESILRNQLYPPKKKEMIMTQQFMKGVIGYQQFWLPKITDIKLLNCVDPPPRNELAKMVSERMLTVDTGDASVNASVKRTADLVHRKPPNRDWLLAMLSTMNPECELFKKNYIRPKVNRFALDDDEDSEMVSNPEGWFDDLPLARSSKKTSLRFTTNKPSEQQKLKRLQMQKALLDSKLKDQQDKLGFMAGQQFEQAFQQEMAQAQEPGQAQAQAQEPVDNTVCPASTSTEIAANLAANSMPVIAQMNSMMINTGGPNIIGNSEDQQEPPISQLGNTEMEGEDRSSIPASLYPKSKGSSYIKTRKERKQNHFMREAEQRTQETLDRMQSNAENSHPNQKS